MIEGKGLSVVAFARDYGLSEAQLHNWLKREHPPLHKHWPRLAEYFGCSIEHIAIGAPEKLEPIPSAVHEDQALYGDPTPLRAATISPPTSPSRRTVELNPSYRLPAATPTEKQCLEYMAAYLAAGREVPGATAATWLELQEKFPITRWKKLLEAQQ
jgi:hypothetical protein